MPSIDSLKSFDAVCVVSVVTLLVAFAVSGMVAPRSSVSLEAFLEQEPKFYSQFDEERLIRYYFKDERDGFYLDVGCAFPKTNSTTYYLETSLSWRGIGIDALDSYRADWEWLRPHSKFFDYAVTDKSGKTLTFYQARHPGLSSVNKEWGEQFGLGQPVPIEVETITLDDLLERENVDRIDFLSMDIEGAEPDALKGFNIKKYAPRLVCIEVHEGAESEPFIRKYFETNGYERIDAYLPYDIANWYYRPKHGG